MAMMNSPLALIKPGRQRRRLPKIPAQLHHQHPAVHRRNLFQQLVCPVIRAIIHQDQLETVAHLLHHLLEPGIEWVTFSSSL